ncbi:MAG: alanine racemase, partial [Clostridia bacterium]
MFTNTILKENIKLVDTAFSLKENGLLPDTYVIDLDQVEKNARAIFDEAEKQGVKLYFMLKQIGRNPLIAKKLIEIGYSGAVCVDFKDALVMKKNNIPIGHMGHLVQIPDCLIETFLKYGVEIITVFSVDKLLKINETAKKLGLVQNISLRIYGDGDNLYDGQQCGFSDAEVLDIVKMSTLLKNVKICGLTTFPCFLYDEKQKKVLPTRNMLHEQRLAELLEEKGLKIQYINAPSATMTETLKMFKEFGANVGEPGHALTGTTPMHAEFSLPEKVAYTYVTEISHNFM